MQQRISPKCVYGHFAEMICIQDICKQPALICKSKSIDCKGKHAQCLMVISIDSAISKLLSDGKIIDAKDALILQSLDKVMQMVLQQKQRYIQLMQHQELRLEGNQRKLFQLFKNGPSSQVLPAFAMTALKKLIKPIDQRINDEKIKIKKQLDKYNEIIKKNIQYIVKLGRKQVEKNQEQKQKLDQVIATPSPQPSYLFSSSLCLYPDFRVQNNGKKIVSLESKNRLIQKEMVTLNLLFQLHRHKNKKIQQKKQDQDLLISMDKLVLEFVINKQSLKTSTESQVTIMDLTYEKITLKS